MGWVGISPYHAPSPPWVYWVLGATGLSLRNAGANQKHEL